MDLKTVLKELKKGGFTIRLDDSKKFIEILRPDLLDTTTVIFRFNRYLPYQFEVDPGIALLPEDVTKKLLDPTLNYILVSLSELDLEGLLSEVSLEEKELRSSRNRLLKDMLNEESGQVRQNIIEQLRDIDLQIAKEEIYGERVCRVMDLLAILNELGFTESNILDRTLTVRNYGLDILELDLDKQSSVRYTQKFEYIDDNIKNCLRMLIAWYTSTPKRIRNMKFSLVEQVLAANLAKKYKWIKREDGKLWVLSGLTEDACKEELICDPLLFRMVMEDNPYPTYLERFIPESSKKTDKQPVVNTGSKNRKGQPSNGGE